MVGKGFLLIHKGRLEQSENFVIIPCNPTIFFGTLGGLKGVIKLYTKAKFSCVHMW